MREKLFTFLLAIVASVGAMFAANNYGTCGADLTWSLNTSTGVLTISGTGAMADYIYGPWYSSRSSIKTVNIDNGVTSIGVGAFFGCSSLTSVTIGNSVTSIGSSAFNGCSGLTSVTIPNSVTSIGDDAFSDCSGLKEVHISDLAAWCKISFYNSYTNPLYYAHNLYLNGSLITDLVIPNSVTSIGSLAFVGCSSLTSVTIPNSVTSIERYAFDGCEINKIYFSGTMEDWCTKSFYPSYISSSYALYINGYAVTNAVIPNSVTSIGNYAFAGCSGLTSITIPNSVTSIGEYTFYNCSGLTSITIPNSVTSIGSSAFYNCSGLTSVTIPNSVTSIGDYAFSNCRGLKEVHISDLAAWCKISFYTSGTNPLYYAHNLYLNGSLITDLVIPNSVTSIGSSAFSGCSGLTSVTIPNSVTSIGFSAFSDCSGLKEVHISDLAAWCKISFNSNPLNYAHNLYLNGELVTDLVIPNSVTSIGGYAFSGCSGLTSVTIPNSVTSIGRYAFSDCSGLTSIIIPNSITTIEFGTFDGCSGLTSVTIPNSVTSISNEAFEGCSGLTAVHISDLEAWCNIFFAWDYPNPLEYAHNLYLNGELVTDLVIPNSVTGINQNSFIGCSITSVTISKSVKSIGSSAFQGCMDLQQIYIYAETPPAISSSTFENISSDAVVYVLNGSLSAYQAAAYWKDMNIKEMVFYATNSETKPTSVTITLRQYIWEMNNHRIVSCGMEGGEEFEGSMLEYIGLEPENEYKDIPIVMTSNTGETSTVNISFTTSALTLKTQQSQPVSANTAILLAETNMSEAETSCGFEWKRNDAPADMPATQVLCPVANGLMAGRLKGLKDDVYYKYRAFYKSAAGNMYYGDWQYIFTGDVTVEFDPILYTYAAQFVTERTATVKGYALAGSEDFTEQGFEYWADSRTSNAPARRAPHYEIGEKHTVKASGISMRVTLSDLDEGTVYKYRTYAKVGGKTLYGAEMTFTTQGTYEEPIVTDIESVDDAGEDDRTSSAIKVFENGQLYILLPNGTRYNLQGMEVK